MDAPKVRQLSYFNKRGKVSSPCQGEGDKGGLHKEEARDFIGFLSSERRDSLSADRPSDFLAVILVRARVIVFTFQFQHFQ